MTELDALMYALFPEDLQHYPDGTSSDNNKTERSEFKSEIKRIFLDTFRTSILNSHTKYEVDSSYRTGVGDL